MREELLKLALPIAEKFVDELLKISGDLNKVKKDFIQKEREYTDLIEQKQGELEAIKILKSEAKKEIDQKITELEITKQDFINRVKQYESLQNEYLEKKKELEVKLEITNLELISAQSRNEEAQKSREDAEKLKTDFEKKIAFLKTDFDKLEMGNEKHNDDLAKLKVREADNFKKEAELNRRANEQNDNDLKLKIREKEVERLIKRYELEKEIKGK